MNDSYNQEHILVGVVPPSDRGLAMKTSESFEWDSLCHSLPYEIEKDQTSNSDI